MDIRVWGSRSGATVRVGRLHLEVWEHGGVTRCVPDTSLCGYRGTHFATVGRGSWEEMARWAVESWQTRREEWQPCE